MYVNVRLSRNQPMVVVFQLHVYSDKTLCDEMLGVGFFWGGGWVGGIFLIILHTVMNMSQQSVWFIPKLKGQRQGPRFSLNGAYTVFLWSLLFRLLQWVWFFGTKSCILWYLVWPKTLWEMISTMEQLKKSFMCARTFCYALLRVHNEHLDRHSHQRLHAKLTLSITHSCVFLHLLNGIDQVSSVHVLLCFSFT